MPQPMAAERRPRRTNVDLARPACRGSTAEGHIYAPTCPSAAISSRGRLDKLAPRILLVARFVLAARGVIDRARYLSVFTCQSARLSFVLHLRHASATHLGPSGLDSLHVKHSRHRLLLDPFGRRRRQSYPERTTRDSALTVHTPIAGRRPLHPRAGRALKLSLTVPSTHTDRCTTRRVYAAATQLGDSYAAVKSSRSPTTAAQHRLIAPTPFHGRHYSIHTYLPYLPPPPPPRRRRAPLNKITPVRRSGFLTSNARARGALDGGFQARPLQYSFRETSLETRPIIEAQRALWNPLRHVLRPRWRTDPHIIHVTAAVGPFRPRAIGENGRPGCHSLDIKVVLLDGPSVVKLSVDLKLRADA
ncbi:hypothetical protein GGX14DRAFT_568887 [Mycena pura]|uniref:Uncharacterized protein n=1 Tax=Mycena pura TaxID=153505 RepID=A0AAD6VC34_9AGAR|nr:hypothetical protein GGX14DRAFT_568887 [Mycena pura]